MKRFQRLSHPEKIVYIFEHRVTEAHSSALRQGGMTEEQFRQAIPAARDLAIERGLYLCPFYDTGMEGWWTARPTQRLAALALQQSMLRNLGEAERNARVFRALGVVSAPAQNYGTSIEASVSYLEAKLAEPLAVSPESDYVYEAVRDAIGRGLGYVPRELAAAP